MQLLFIRHAESESNLAGRMQGRWDDNLTVQGEWQARQLGRWLLRQPAPTALYCSPQRRAQATLHLLQEQCPAVADCSIFLEPDLQELDQGILTGLTWSEAQARYPELCSRLEQTPEWLPVPQAESPVEARRRAAAVLQRWFKHHGQGDRLWVVTHGGLLVHLISELLGCPRTWGFDITPTAWFDFYLDVERISRQDENRFNPTLSKINHFNSKVHLME